MPTPAKAKLFYLAIGPDIFIPVVEQLSKHGLVEGNARVVVEKPLVATPNPLKKSILRCTYLNENQIYRIDHYLGKEMVQNLFALRFITPSSNHCGIVSGFKTAQISISEQSWRRNAR